MGPDPKWHEMSQALLDIWRGMGWQALTGLAVVVLAWKALDAWGKKRGGKSD